MNRVAMSALQLFFNAVLQEGATVELARQVIADIERAKRSAAHHARERGRG